jgi:DNA sulfur modification protein DndD
MLLRKVILENYGLYRGHNEFDLIPKTQPNGQKQKPIILFGGKNGAGKTTLLDAVRLTLYGKQSIGAAVTNKKYHDYLDSKIHRARNDLVQRQWARIAIEFDYVMQGEQNRYYVERKWRRLPDGEIDETLIIRKDGYDVDDIEAKHWEAFAASIVPERLSQLFFFDGEKIKDMAEDISGSTAVKESITSLLGLDMVDRLKADLNLYLSREAKNHGSAEDQQQLEAVDINISTIDDDLGKHHNQLIDKAEALQVVNERIQEIENDLHAAGSAYADLRISERQKQSESETAIELVTKQMRMETEGLLPLALCPNISKQLVEQLKTEKVIKEHGIVAEAIEKMGAELKKQLAKSKILDSESAEEAKALIDATADKQASLPKKLQETPIIHDLSEQSAHRIQEWLKNARKSATRVKNLATEYEKLHRKQQSSSTVLSRAPEQEALQPIMDRLNKQTTEAGKIQAEQEAISKKIHELEYRRSEFEREKTKLEAKVLAQQKFIDQTQLIEKTQKALSAYHQRLTQMKVDALQHTVTDCFNHLLRKEDVLHSISIDPKTFKVTLNDRRGQAIPKEDLSSGEKQIYAISVLWGLAKTSGRPLPVIVDTPLGRLDSDHRRNLIQNYFPNAGHQVILLSTDTEVDEDLYQELHPNISHCFHLKYDDKERYTSFKEEYFWKEKSHA